MPDARRTAPPRVACGEAVDEPRGRGEQLDDRVEVPIGRSRHPRARRDRSPAAHRRARPVRSHSAQSTSSADPPCRRAARPAATTSATPLNRCRRTWAGSSCHAPSGSSTAGAKPSSVGSSWRSTRRSGGAGRPDPRRRSSRGASARRGRHRMRQPPGALVRITSQPRVRLPARVRLLYGDDPSRADREHRHGRLLGQGQILTADGERYPGRDQGPAQCGQ